MNTMVIILVRDNLWQTHSCDSQIDSGHIIISKYNTTLCIAFADANSSNNGNRKKIRQTLFWRSRRERG